ncbi:carboxymuconolactone decarboxylase family protein [Rhizorhapis sp. SPR117]|uniref:carboxymuconolactone decarboxylase family protein n=1 Tax=Rhizorhapis sp. SPR117 TaxID=2912611 RepID=UPI001F38EC05|nr:carboxymuconolactone decarboxylase family protein [Rhizorhapis sp. SPR117]
MNNEFEPLWTDKSLGLRTRSLITVAILCTLRATDELSIHFPAAIRNGATIEELEQLIYQVSGYPSVSANLSRKAWIMSDDRSPSQADRGRKHLYNSNY